MHQTPVLCLHEVAELIRVQLSYLVPVNVTAFCHCCLACVCGLDLVLLTWVHGLNFDTKFMSGFHTVSRPYLHSQMCVSSSTAQLLFSILFPPVWWFYPLVVLISQTVYTLAFVVFCFKLFGTCEALWFSLAVHKCST